jgi:hypothetical protein
LWTDGFVWWSRYDDGQVETFRQSGSYQADIFVVPFNPTEDLPASFDITCKNPTGVVEGTPFQYDAYPIMDGIFGWGTIAHSAANPNYFGAYLCA